MYKSIEIHLNDHLTRLAQEGTNQNIKHGLEAGLAKLKRHTDKAFESKYMLLGAGTSQLAADSSISHHLNLLSKFYTRRFGPNGSKIATGKTLRNEPKTTLRSCSKNTQTVPQTMP